MRLRILHSIRSVNPHGGGPVEGVKQFARVNTAAGHSIEVVCLDSPTDPWVRDFPLKCYAMGPAKGSYGYVQSLVPWLRENGGHYDAVIVDGLWQYNGFAVWRAFRGTKVPYFVFTHGMLDPWFKRTYPLKHLKKWLYWPWGEYRVLRDAQAVLFTCEEERRLAKQSFWLYRARERVVSFGTGAPKGDPVKQREQFLAAFPETQNQHCLLFLGRVHVKKGTDLLFRAFAELVRENSNPALTTWRLVVAGPNDHPYGVEMKALAVSLGVADRITWTGMLTGDSKWGAFYQAGAFVLPSHQENFGIAVAEALACGIPVLISDKVNIWREISEDGAGLIANDDLPSTKDLLKRWLETPEAARAVMATSAKQCFATRFDVEQCARALIAVLEEKQIPDGSAHCRGC